MGGSLLTQLPLRASADVNACRVISLSGAYTAAHPADKTKEPIGITYEWSVLAPLVDFAVDATIVARGSKADTIPYAGRGLKAHAQVGATAITGQGPVMADSDGSGKVVPAVVPCWIVGYVAEAAPVGSKIEVLIDPVYVPTGGTF